MVDANQVTTLIVAGSILVVGVALAGGGVILWMGGRRLVGIGGVVLGLGAAVAALLFTLSPVVARRYDPGEAGDVEDGRD